MLRLTHDDLGKPATGGPAGVCVWWLTPPGAKRPTLAVAWSSLVLLSPSIEWPEGLHPERHPLWKRDSFRFSFSPPWPAVAVFNGVPVPSLTRVFGIQRGDAQRVRVCGWGVVRAPGRVTLVKLEDVAGRCAYVCKRSMRRVSEATDKRTQELEVRVTFERPERPLLALVYVARRLRAVLVALEETEVTAWRSS